MPSPSPKSRLSRRTPRLLPARNNPVRRRRCRRRRSTGSGNRQIVRLRQPRADSAVPENVTPRKLTSSAFRFRTPALPQAQSEPSSRARRTRPPWKEAEPGKAVVAGWDDDWLPGRRQLVDGGLHRGRLVAPDIRQYAAIGDALPEPLIIAGAPSAASTPKSAAAAPLSPMKCLRSMAFASPAIAAVASLRG